MSSEEKIRELEARILKLEAAEQKRIRRRRILICFRILKYISIIALIAYLYFYVDRKFIKPYKENMAKFEENASLVEDFVKDNWDALGKYNPFQKKKQS